MKAYKITEYNMTCKGYQYEMGKLHVHDGEVEKCSKGFHSCEILLDCFKYYNPDMSNRFFEVELSGEIIKDGDKFVSSEIKFVKELLFDEFCIIQTATDSCTSVHHTHYCNNVKASMNLIFCANIECSKFKIFNRRVTEGRYNEVLREINKFKFVPKINNLDELLERFRAYERIPSKLIMWYPRLDYLGMPIEMYEYLTCLDEFDNDVFLNIVGGV